MNNTTHDWYDLVKDIIIPSTEVLLTLIIGVFIAIILKRKEDKAKIKQLLIDHYMEYLNVKMNDFEYEYKKFTISILHELKQSEIILNNSNRHIQIAQIEQRINHLQTQLDNFNDNDINWSPYTYRFAFLLGKKKYFKKILPLENIITNELTSKNKYNKLKSETITKITQNNNLKEALNQISITSINKAIDDIESMIVTDYNNYHYLLFNPFSTKIANLINRY